MDTYAKVLKTRLRIYGVLITIITLLLILTTDTIISKFYTPVNATFAQGFIPGFRLGLFIVVEAYILLDIHHIYAALKDSEKMKAMLILEKDERRVYIQTKIGFLGFNIILIGIAVATIIAGAFSQTVFFTLLAVLVFISVTKASLKFYFLHKY